MKSKFILLCILFLATSVGLNAQTLLKGKVLDSATNAPLAYVTVHLKKKDVGVATALDGSFSFQISYADTLEVSMVGYL